MKDFVRLVRLFRPHAKAALVAVLAMLGVAVFTTLVAYLFGPLFDQVLTPGQNDGGEAGAGDRPRRARARRRLSARGARSGRRPVIHWLDEGLLRRPGRRGRDREEPGASSCRSILFAAFLLKNLCAFAAEYRFNAVGLAFVRDVEAPRLRAAPRAVGRLPREEPLGRPDLARDGGRRPDPEPLRHRPRRPRPVRRDARRPLGPRRLALARADARRPRRRSGDRRPGRPDREPAPAASRRPDGSGWGT